MPRRGLEHHVRGVDGLREHVATQVRRLCVPPARRCKTPLYWTPRVLLKRSDGGSRILAVCPEKRDRLPIRNRPASPAQHRKAVGSFQRLEGRRRLRRHNSADCAGGCPPASVPSDGSGYYGGAGDCGTGLGPGPEGTLNCLADPVDYDWHALNAVAVAVSASPRRRRVEN